MGKILIMLVEDHPVVRQGIRVLLSAENDLQVVAEARDGAECLTLAKLTNPNVALMDLAMPGMNGIQATRLLKREKPELRVLMLTTYTDGEFVKDAVAAGASGYVLKHESPDELITAIRQVHSGKPYFSRALPRPLREASSRAVKEHRRSDAEELSRRQQQVMELIAEGFANKRIAAELGISIKTVEKHRHEVMGKLDIHETAEITRYVMAQRAIRKLV